MQFLFGSVMFFGVRAYSNILLEKELHRRVEVKTLPKRCLGCRG